jgi:hypothetical protein
MEQSVPKRRHIKFRRWGITQKKTYNSVFVALGIEHKNAHTPYCHLSHVRLYIIFPRYQTNGTVFGKQIYGTRNVCFDPLSTILV